MNKPPWQMTPEEFGKSYPPMRTIGKANHPEWRYLPSLPACPTRAAAVLDAHRHFVTRALEEGVAVPDHIAALYRQPEPPPERVQAEPDLLRLTAARPNEAADAPARAASAQADLTQRLADTEATLKQVIGAALLAHDDAMKLCSTVHDGLTRAMNERAAKFEQERADMRQAIADREAQTKETLDRLAATMRAQAQVLAASSKSPTKPKRWHFKIQRDAAGNIAGMDAEPC